MDLVANAIRTAVLERIADGLTVQGDPMLDGAVDKYSEAYARWKGVEVKPRIKKKSQRSTRLPPRGRALYTPGDRFNLSGDMLRAWQVLVVELTRCVVGFTSTGEALKALGNHERRPTFSLNKEEVDAIIDEVCEKYGWQRG